MNSRAYEGQYAHAQIALTADEQLREDAEFNALMQCGTVVRMERFEVEEFRSGEPGEGRFVLRHRPALFNADPRAPPPPAG